MAGDWIKIELSTPEKAEVLSITATMGWEDSDLTVGKLLRLWRWFDQHTTDGNAHNVTSALLDRIIGVTGFCSAVEKVGWLVINPDGICLPGFEKHNGSTAKSRSLTARRVANYKDKSKGNAEVTQKVTTTALPREEKRREEKNINLTTSVAAVVVENRAEDETDWQRRLRKSCESLKAKIVERFPNAEPTYEVETEKLVCFYRDRPSRADPSLAVWKWFERVKPPAAWEGGKCTPEWLEKWAEQEDAKRGAVT